MGHTHIPHDLRQIFWIAHIHHMRGNKPRFECAVEIDSKENNLATKATAGGTSKTWSDAANGRNHLLPFGVTCYVLYYIYVYETWLCIFIERRYFEWKHISNIFHCRQIGTFQ